ncbi:MAG: hypothetical protein JW951_10475 [Lentisphaerae bacterium]|nr:hypothetical protein [Lentisphaerota bacterium]
MLNRHAMLNWVQNHYDKLVALVMLVGLLASLLYLAFQVGMTQSRQRQFVDRIDAMRPAHQDATGVDPAVYERAMQAVRQPAQLGGWTNALFVPEVRVYCVDCRRPIPYEAEVCPFCAAEQPVDKEEREDWDGDGDGMWDSWERAQDLDPRDARDAELDPDGDGFTNIEEFGADPRTDPHDEDDAPPITAKLRLLELVPDPFKLRFKSVIGMPDGSRKFAINTRGNTRTYFRKLGEDVEGFTLFQYEPRREMQDVGGIRREVDMSVLTLRRGEKLIPLVRGKDVQYNEYTARLRFTPDGTEYTVRINDELVLQRKKYRVISIDTERESLVLRRLHDGRDLVVRRMPQRVTEKTSRTSDF